MRASNLPLDRVHGFNKPVSLAILKVARCRASFDFLGFEQFRGDREGGEGFEEDGHEGKTT
jgi:hypothetical protein